MSNHPNRGKNRRCSTPRAEQVRAAREAAGLTQSQAADLVCSSLRAWQQWEAEEGTPDHRRMHPAFWRLFKIELLC